MPNSFIPISDFSSNDLVFANAGTPAAPSESDQTSGFIPQEEILSNPHNYNYKNLTALLSQIQSYGGLILNQTLNVQNSGFCCLAGTKFITNNNLGYNPNYTDYTTNAIRGGNPNNQTYSFVCLQSIPNLATSPNLQIFFSDPTGQTQSSGNCYIAGNNNGTKTLYAVREDIYNAPSPIGTVLAGLQKAIAATINSHNYTVLAPITNSSNQQYVLSLNVAQTIYQSDFPSFYNYFSVSTNLPSGWTVANNAITISANWMPSSYTLTQGGTLGAKSSGGIPLTNVSVNGTTTAQDISISGLAGSFPVNSLQIGTIQGGSNNLILPVGLGYQVNEGADTGYYGVTNSSGASSVQNGNFGIYYSGSNSSSVPVSVTGGSINIIGENINSNGQIGSGSNNLAAGLAVNYGVCVGRFGE